MKNDSIKFSIVILTYNRESHIRKQISNVVEIEGCEVIIVDNCSDDNYIERIKNEYPSIKAIYLDKNYGAVGRNFGMAEALGKYVITLDDDVYGITSQHLIELEKAFNEDELLKSVCFKVTDEKTGEICNWCHPRDPKIYGDKKFETYNISEGAVCFKKDLFNKIELYPWDFFISHEGPDLAYRLLNAGYKSLYIPDVTVIHAYAEEGRKSWRRYYYDTRNTIWLAYRNYNIQMLITKLPIQLLAMFVYSTRDGFLRYYFKAIIDGVKGLKGIKNQRQPISASAYKKIKLINTEKPSFLYYFKKRFLKIGVKV
jgi:GT2 family glycosyltransferase